MQKIKDDHEQALKLAMVKDLTQRLSDGEITATQFRSLVLMVIDMKVEDVKAAKLPILGKK